MQADERPPRLRVLPELSELGQYVTEVPFYPPPPVSLFVPSLVQRGDYHGGPLGTSDRDVSNPRAKEVSFQGHLGYFREGSPIPPIACARFAVAVQAVGADGTQGETLHLVIASGFASAVGRGAD